MQADEPPAPTFTKSLHCPPHAAMRTRRILDILDSAGIIPPLISSEYESGQLIVLLQRYDMDLVEYRARHPRAFQLAGFERDHLGPLLQKCALVGVVHLDLRPENVVVNVDARGAVVDARLIDVEPHCATRDQCREYVYQDGLRRGEYKGRAVARRERLMRGAWCSLLSMRRGWSALGDGSWIDDAFIDLYDHDLTEAELELVTTLVVQQAAQLDVLVTPRFVADTLSRCNRIARMPLTDWAHRSRDLDRARDISAAAPAFRARGRHTIVRVNGRWRLEP